GTAITNDAASEPTTSSGISQVQSLSDPNAIALLIACTAMHGYSEPVCSYSRQSPKPSTARGTSAPTGEPPRWMPPNTAPVRIAAGHTPFQLRSAPKKNPRKKNSSTTGAATHTSTIAATSATVLSRVPSWSSTSSSSMCTI